MNGRSVSGPPAHHLKSYPANFAALFALETVFELRRNDRPFAAGDLVKISEWDPELAAYTGRARWFLIAQVSVGLVVTPPPPESEALHGSIMLPPAGFVVLGYRDPPPVMP